MISHDYGFLMTNPLKCAALVALACYVFLNMALAAARPFKDLYIGGHMFVDQHPLIEKLQHYLAGDAAPDVLLLGSSLVMCANTLADAAFEKRRSPCFGEEYYCYAQSNYFASELSCRLHHDVDCASLSVPGGMIADAQGITSLLSKHRRLPKAIVLGIAPRDFSSKDSLYAGTILKEEMQFEKEQLLSRKALSVLLEKCFRLYETRSDFQFMTNRISSAVIEAALGNRSAVSHFKTLIGLDRRTPEATPARSFLQAEAETYKKTYCEFAWEASEYQFRQLEKLERICDAHDVELIIVNMPLSAGNKRLMPPGLLDDYLSRLKNHCDANGTAFINADQTCFPEKDYRDSVHLRSSGALKFLRHIAAAMADDPKISEALKHSQPDQTRSVATGSSSSFE